MTIAKPIPNPIDALRANVSVPFEEARAMPPSVYTSDAFVQAELKNISKLDLLQHKNILILFLEQFKKK